MDKKTFVYETYYEQKLSFEIDDEHFKYRLNDGEQLIATWNDILSLKINRFGNTLDIIIDQQDKPVTVPFGTDNFLGFLEEMTSRMGKANAKKITTMAEPFAVSKTFYAMLTIFLVAPIILLTTLLFNFSRVLDMESLSAYIAVIAPAALIIYNVCIPIIADLKKDRLILKGVLRKSVYQYADIKSFGFELLDMKKRGSLLVVIMNMKNGKKIKIKWLKNLILFFIVAKFKLDTYKTSDK